MVQEKVQILWNKKVGPGYFKMGLTCHDTYATATPGQFVMLRLADRLAPLLRRPFSIHGVIHNGDRIQGIELLYKVVGEATRLLSLCRPGDSVDILGPLGTGFSISENVQRIYIAAGGIGVAPLVFLASTLVERGVAPGLCMVFVGGRSKDDLLCTDAFLRMGMQVRITTDDGSEGERCLVTHPLEIAVKENPPDVIYACGPLRMLQCVGTIAENHAVACQVSIETLMACGIGACLGCAVEVRNDPTTYLHACIDGPVFNSKRITLGPFPK